MWRKWEGDKYGGVRFKQSKNCKEVCGAKLPGHSGRASRSDQGVKVAALCHVQ